MPEPHHHQHLDDPPSRIDALATQLASLGAETKTERHVKRVLPWFVSLAIHLGVVGLALVVTWTVTHRAQDHESVLIVADFNALTYDPVSRMDASAEPASESPVQQQVQVAPLEPLPLEKLETAEADPLDALVGTAASSATPLDHFAPRPERDGARFAGVSASNARTIVYVIDASGSMVSHLKTVVGELMRSVSNLTLQQSFGVIFFQSGTAIEFPPAGKLKSPTDDVQRKLRAWIDDRIIARGGTNPITAIEAAIKLEPDAVFLLSQDITGYGQFEVDQRDLLALLEQLNPADPATKRRRTQINCIQFLQQDELETMRKIADIHGGPGGYKFLSGTELGLTP